MQKEFEAVSATTANSLQLMRNAFARVGNTLGSTLLPIISGVSKLIASMVSGFGALLESSSFVRYGLIALGGAFALLKIKALAARLGSFVLTSALHPLRFTLLKMLPASYIASIGDKLGLSTTVELSKTKAPPKAAELQNLAISKPATTTSTNSSVTNANTITIVTGANPKEVVRAVATYSD
ncbi:hypothetical protein BKH43_02440 [Helicobacter sp. 13S00401-1]|nr:hypothetical protein BKH43_02440 [Helicobacter sp. 13S00401-1]